MHIPDGYLSPQTYVPLYGVSFVFWSVALKKMKKELSVKHIPCLAMASAFSFLVMIFNPLGFYSLPLAAGSVIILCPDQDVFVLARTQQE